MKKLNKMFKMHFFLKPDFTFFKPDSIIGVVIVFEKKLKKNNFIFEKMLFLFLDIYLSDTKKCVKNFQKPIK